MINQLIEFETGSGGILIARDQIASVKTADLDDEGWKVDEGFPMVAIRLKGSKTTHVVYGTMRSLRLFLERMPCAGPAAKQTIDFDAMEEAVKSEEVTQQQAAALIRDLGWDPASLPPLQNNEVKD